MRQIAISRMWAGLAASVFLSSALAPSPPMVGRWDMTVATASGLRPSWLEVQPSGARTLVGRFVGAEGTARPISRIEVAGDTFSFSIPPQWEPGDQDLRVQGSLAGDSLSGWLVDPAGVRMTWTARRAPLLRRTTPVEWGDPVEIFDGQDMSGWHPARGPSQWTVVDHTLTSPRSGANLVTDRTFTDVQLHAEFRCPTGTTSGVYLRGRYAVAIADSVGLEPTVERLGAISGFIAPSEDVARKAGEWQAVDAILIGRHVTVILNGTTIISNQEIPGITGGALDSDEASPGPIMLQGDHGPIEFRKIIIKSAK